MSTFGIGYSLIKKFCEEQKPIDWYRAKLVPEMFRPDEREVHEWVSSHLVKHHALPQLETLYAKFQTIQQFPTPEPSSYYLQHVENRLYYERINQANIDSQKVLKDNQGDHSTAMSILSDNLAFIATHKYRLRIVDVSKEGPSMVLNAYHNLFATDSVGVFGWPYMDKSSGGLMPGDVVSIVGRTGLGKTWLSLHVFIKNWLKGRRPLFVSMEMSPLPILQRVTAMYAHTNIEQLKLGGYSSQTLKKFSGAMVKMHALNGAYVVDGNLAASVEDIYLLASQLKCDMVIIDGAYMVKHPNKRLDRFTRVSENTEMIKQRTSDLQIPTVASYQFARSAVKDKKKSSEVGLEDIGLSDTIGQISSVVLGLFQEESVETLESRNVRVLKGRNGEVGGFKINWNFIDLDFDQADIESPEKDQEQLEYI